jgi:hypothetical protein
MKSNNDLYSSSKNALIKNRVPFHISVHNFFIFTFADDTGNLIIRRNKFCRLVIIKFLWLPSLQEIDYKSFSIIHVKPFTLYISA